MASASTESVPLAHRPRRPSSPFAYLVTCIAAAASARAFASFLPSSFSRSARSPLAPPAAALRVRAVRLDTRRERAVATAATAAAAAVDGVGSRDDWADRARSWRVRRRAAEEERDRRGAMRATATKKGDGTREAAGVEQMSLGVTDDGQGAESGYIPSHGTRTSGQTWSVRRPGGRSESQCSESA